MFQVLAIGEEVFYAVVGHAGEQAEFAYEIIINHLGGDEEFLADVEIEILDFFMLLPGPGGK